VLKPALTRADELLAERGQHPLPHGVTPHKLRHTFASILIALGRDPKYVMEQLGHTDPKFTLRIYAHVMRFSEDERARVKALGCRVGGSETRTFPWARLGSNQRPLACEARWTRRHRPRYLAPMRAQARNRCESDPRKLRQMRF
jgi:hypothetical protein